MRLIDADAINRAIADSRISLHTMRLKMRVSDLLLILKSAPTIDAEPVRHSYWFGWEFDGYADGFPVFDTWVCNECGEEFRSEGEPPAFNFCPNCGAKMDGDPHDSGQ